VTLNRTIGVIEILLSGIAFGLVGVFGKMAYALGVTPGELLSLRFLLAAGVLGLGLGLFRRSSFRVPFKTWGACAALGVLGYAVFASCYFLALQGISASLTVLLLYINPAFVAAGAWLLFREKLSSNNLTALPVAFTGLLLLVWGELSISSGVAVGYGIMAAVVYAMYILASGRWLANVSPYSSALYIQLFAGISLGLIHLREPARVVEVLSSAWLIIVAIALISTVLAMVLFLSGLQKLKKAEVSILSMGEPLTGILAASLYLGENLTVMQAAGAALILAALVLSSIEHKSGSH